jgi:hypothetical protein
MMHEHEDSSNGFGLFLWTTGILVSPVMAIIIAAVINYVIVRFSLVELVHARPVTFLESLAIYFLLLASPVILGIFKIVKYIFLLILKMFLEVISKLKFEEYFPRNINRNDPVSIQVMKCRHCREKVMPGKEHTCFSGLPGSSFTAPLMPTEDTSNFFLSYITAEYTNDMIMGFAIGRSAPGAILGAGATDERGHDSWGQRFRGWVEEQVTDTERSFREDDSRGFGAGSSNAQGYFSERFDSGDVSSSGESTIPSTDGWSPAVDSGSRDTWDTGSRDDTTTSQVSDCSSVTDN